MTPLVKVRLRVVLVPMLDWTGTRVNSEQKGEKNERGGL